MKEIEIKVLTLPHFKGLSLPEYKTEGAAGFDLVAACTNDIIVESSQIVLIPTGLIFEIPDGFEVQIRPRSGLALKDGIGILNSPGTIDSDYRGEIKIILYNFSKKSFIVKRGMRIAQAVISEVFKGKFVMVDKLSDTKRGNGGFGHTKL